jgi:hypothetical protein
MGDENPFTEVESTWLAMSDRQMFEAVRSDDNDHFTYEYLKQRDWEDNSDAREFFDSRTGKQLVKNQLYL